MMHERNDICLIEIENLKKSDDELKSDLRVVLQKLSDTSTVNSNLSQKVTYLCERLDNRHPKDDHHFDNIDKTLAEITKTMAELSKSHALDSQRINGLEKSKSDQDAKNLGVFLALVSSFSLIIGTWVWTRVVEAHTGVVK